MPQPNLAAAYQAAQQAASALAQPAVPLNSRPDMPQSMPMPTMPAAKPASAKGIIPGTAGMAFTGNEVADKMQVEEFQRYVKLWGMKFAQMKNQYPDMDSRRIIQQIGPAPSTIKSFAELVDALGRIDIDPAAQQLQYDTQKAKMQFDMNRQLMGDEAALNRQLAEFQSSLRMKEADTAFGREQEATKEQRTFQRKRYAAEDAREAEKMALDKRQLDLSAQQLELSKKEVDARVQQVAQEIADNTPEAKAKTRFLEAADRMRSMPIALEKTRQDNVAGYAQALMELGKTPEEALEAAEKKYPATAIQNELRKQLATYVADGTMTQAQADAIYKALTEVPPPNTGDGAGTGTGAGAGKGTGKGTGTGKGYRMGTDSKGAPMMVIEE